jgi:carbon monoxide dehydrogenase subunit G
MKTSKMVRLSALAMIMALLCISADLDPNQQFKMILAWQKPKSYPPPMLEGMNVDTLNTMLSSGALQWYEPRPEPDTWDAVVGQKVHAPAELLWSMAIDYEAQCKLMPDTFLNCKTQSREGNKVTNVYQIKTSVVMYSFKFEMIDKVVEDPPKGMHIDTIEGGLKGRQVDLLFIPVDQGANTLIFMRYFGAMHSLGPTMRVGLNAMPMVEPTTTAGAANYHLRAYKNEAEKRVGYQTPREPPRLAIENLDLPTLRRLNLGSAGLIRETPAGKFIDVTAYTFIDARPEQVWEVITDFEHYEQIFPGSTAKVESRDGNTVIVRQEMSKFSVLVFDFGYELHSKYILDPPQGLVYNAIDGLYEGSHGDLRLLPLENGTKTLLFSTAGLNLEKDPSLVTRVVKSGAFPVENMLNLVGTESTLACIKAEAEKRAAKRPTAK